MTYCACFPHALKSLTLLFDIEYSIFVGQLYEDISLVLHAGDLFFLQLTSKQ